VTSAAMHARPQGAADFDFLIGKWTVEHRKLRHRLQGSDDWLTFSGTMNATLILGGLGNFDENVLRQPDGTYQACTVRIFDPASSRWSIRWIDGRSPRLDPPVVGAFRDGIGTFFGDDVLDGRPVRVRFSWSDISSAGARWEQAFSADGGASWEVNWVMEFRKI